MGRQNEHAPTPVHVRCRVCGHEWETISPFPQCADPGETQESCGRSRDWEYVYPEDDPRSPEYDADRWDAEPEHEQAQEATNPPDDESDESSVADETDSDPVADEPEDDDMVTANEYDEFHGEREPEPEPETEPEPEPEPEPPDAVKEAQAKQVGDGFSLPVERRTLMLALAAVVVVIAVVLLLRSRGGGTAEPTGEPERVPIEPDDEPPGESDEEPEEPEEPEDPIEAAHKFDKKSHDEIELFDNDA